MNNPTKTPLKPRTTAGVAAAKKAAAEKSKQPAQSPAPETPQKPAGK